MMLKSATKSGQKQVAVSSNIPAQVMYTVPANRVFRGYLVGSSTSSAIGINGAQVCAYVNSTGAACTPIPLELLAGTIVTCVANNAVSIHGIEEDA